MEKQYYIVQYFNPTGDGRPDNEGVMNKDFFMEMMKKMKKMNIN